MLIRFLLVSSNKKWGLDIVIQILSYIRFSHSMTLVWMTLVLLCSRSYWNIVIEIVFDNLVIVVVAYNPVIVVVDYNTFIVVVDL